MKIGLHKKMSLISFNKVVLSVIAAVSCVALAVENNLLLGSVVIAIHQSFYLYMNSLYCKRLSRSIVGICNIHKKQFILPIFCWNLLPFAIVLLVSVAYSAIYIPMSLFLVLTLIHLGVAALSLKKGFSEAVTTAVFLIALAAHTVVFNYCAAALLE